MAPCIVPTRATGDVPPSPSGIIAWAAARSRRIRRRPLARWRRHEAGIVAREERDDGSNLFRLADSAQRGPLRELGEEIFVVHHVLSPRVKIGQTALTGMPFLPRQAR